MTKTVPCGNELHKFLIWDTAGQERVSMSLLSKDSCMPYSLLLIKQGESASVTDAEGKKAWYVYIVLNVTVI